jgi:hypothetical protein
MQFKLDENLPPAAAELLRSLGHDVSTVYDQGLQGHTAPNFWRPARARARSSFHWTWTSQTSWCIRPSGTPG